jgi:hypothetical protein
MQRGGKATEWLLVAWQVAAAAAAVGIAAGVLAALLVMPKTGYACGFCDDVSCQNFLGWNCGTSVNRKGYCEVLLFPDSSVTLVCPAGERVALPKGHGLDGVQAQCAARCPDVAPAPPQRSPAAASTSAGAAGTGTTS